MKLLWHFILWMGLACTTQLPGEVDAGLFHFSASTVWDTHHCKPDMVVGDGFRFEGRFRLESNLSEGYFVYRSVNREAQFDGQNMVSDYSLEHGFEDACEGCARSVLETLEVALLSKTQNEALHAQCPCELSDKGIPLEGIPVDEGQNIFPPGPVPGGFDAVRACGSLTVHVETTPLPGEICPETCYKNDILYYLEGIRKE